MLPAEDGGHRLYLYEHGHFILEQLTLNRNDDDDDDDDNMSHDDSQIHYKDHVSCNGPYLHIIACKNRYFRHLANAMILLKF